MVIDCSPAIAITFMVCLTICVVAYFFSKKA